jgi:probable HAF family extracellular repeat protein
MKPRSLTRREVIVGSLGAWGALAAVGDCAPVAAARLARQGGEVAITDLGGFGRASAINSSGQIAGTSGSTTALWDGGELLDLGAWPGDSSSEAFAINDAGVIVGASWSASYQPHAVVWSQGQVFDLGALAGGTASMALAVNEEGQVAGWSESGGGTHHAVRWDLDSGQVVDLGTGAGINAEATGINDSGVIVGWFESSDGTAHAVVIDPDGFMTDLGGLSLALAINTGGQIAGVARTGGDSDHAVVWEEGEIIDLDPTGSSSRATAISDDGLVVGSTVRSGSDVAVQWEASTQEASTLGGLSDESTVAYGINESGQIVGESGGRPVLWEPSNGS